MKQKIKTLLAASILCLISHAGFSQKANPRVAPWASDRGYWVAESARQTPLQHVIRFYTNDNILVYKETLSGMKLNTGRRSVKMKLKKALEASIIAWENNRTTIEETALVKTMLR